MLPKNKKFLLPRRSLPAGDSDAQFAPEGDIPECRLPREETLAGVRKIDAILFDWGGVLVNVRKKYCPNSMIDLVDNIDFIIGKTMDKELSRQIMEKIMEKNIIKKSKFNKLLEMVVNKYEPYRPLWRLLPILHQNYKLAIVRNGTSLTWPIFEKKYKNFRKNFDTIVLSGLEGLKKPDKKIYLLTAKRLAVQPKKCLFIDDLRENIEGAKKAGMQTLWWQKSDDSLKKLLEILK